MTEPLRAALARLAGLPRLLVASDYDGVLAPIVTEPSKAFPLPGAIAELAGLAELPGTTVALVSGRARRDLAAVSGAPPSIVLVGSHGSEFADGVQLTPAQAELYARVEAELRRLVRDLPGVWVETKPTTVVVHTRTAPADVTAAAQAAVRAGPASWPGVHTTNGKEVVELAVTTVHKGTAVAALRERAAADGVLFVGDDRTDENAFAVLRDGDVGVKVGPGETRARFRVDDPAAAVRVFALLRELRAGSATG
ncbi:MAG TPA: trehalose-phosphatase [Natronosporangium sp.]